MSFERAHAILPSTAAVGEDLRLTVQAWDEYERLLREFERAFSLRSTDPEATLPDRVSLRSGDDGWPTRGDVAFGTPGIHYLELVPEPTGGAFAANPVRVTESAPEKRLHWGDIHLHSRRSDGAGSIEKGLAFGRDVMALDVVAYTDHDTMGFFVPPQVQRWLMRRRQFAATARIAEEFYQPGSFVTLLVADPSDEATLGRAHVGEARAVVVATDDDTEDALAVLTARQLNPEVTVVAAATNRGNVAKLRRAGVDTVISPATIGGHLLVESSLGGDVDIEEVAGELAGDG